MIKQFLTHQRKFGIYGNEEAFHIPKSPQLTWLASQTEYKEGVYLSELAKLALPIVEVGYHLCNYWIFLSTSPEDRYNLTSLSFEVSTE